jgi:hypothetical protein
MSVASVIESPLDLEPVGRDSFIDDLEKHTPESQARLADLLRRVEASPRRIFD